MSSTLSGFYDRVRAPASREAARGRPTVSGFGALRAEKYCLLVSYRRSGEPVPTPVWFGLDDDGDRLYVRTESHAGKVRRVRATPAVMVAPCSARGKPRGPLARGNARVLDGVEVGTAERALRSNYGLGRRLYESLLGARASAAAYLEVTPV